MQETLTRILCRDRARHKGFYSAKEDTQRELNSATLDNNVLWLSVCELTKVCTPGHMIRSKGQMWFKGRDSERKGRG